MLFDWGTICYEDEPAPVGTPAKAESFPFTLADMLAVIEKGMCMVEAHLTATLEQQLRMVTQNTKRLAE